jgi:hypothetical protein
MRDARVVVRPAARRYLRVDPKAHVKQQQADEGRGNPEGHAWQWRVWEEGKERRVMSTSSSAFYTLLRWLSRVKWHVLRRTRLMVDSDKIERRWRGEDAASFIIRLAE